MNGAIFRTGSNGIENAIAFPTLSQINAAAVLQDSTYQLTNGTIYTKYDASTYTDQDRLHGVYGGGDGVWMIYAYANGGSIGDVTNQYERDNVTVSGSATNLGTLVWSPPTDANRLWQIGTADRKADEFRLGNVPRQYGLFNQVPANLTYTIGSSTPANNWYYAQTQVGIWTVNFNLSKSYSGNAHLTVALAGVTPGQESSCRSIVFSSC